MQDVDEAIEQAKKFGEILRQDNLLEDMGSYLRNLNSRNLQDANSWTQIRKKLLEDITAKKAFSLLRLGDGEGNTLFWGRRKDDFPDLANVCMDRIWKLHFGRNKGDAGKWDAIYEGMVEAVKKTSYIGIPTLSQASAALARLPGASEEAFDIRGTAGVIAVWDWVNQHKENLNDEMTFVNCHVHKSLLDFYPDLIRQATNLSVITCYPELLIRLHRKCGIEEGNTFLIPPQAVNIKSTPDDIHFPNRFNEISLELSGIDRTGELFFVGAGLAGKLYCEVIRQAGGMAVDVGSLMDVWMGIGVRPYQSSKFVELYKVNK